MVAPSRVKRRRKRKMKTEIRNGVEWTILEGNDYFSITANSSPHLVCRENSSPHLVCRENSSPHLECRENSSPHLECRANSSPHLVCRENSSPHLECRANSSPHLVCWDFSTVYDLSGKCKIKKGPRATIIKPNYPSNIKEWSKLKGLHIKKNRIYLYKVLRLNGTDFHTGTIDYLKEAIAPDWKAKFKEECGYGLHLADSPEGAKYFLQDRTNYLLIEVSATLEDCKPFPGQPQYPMKLRARACRFERIIEKVENGKKII
jgi:hypothetical protein